MPSKKVVIELSPKQAAVVVTALEQIYHQTLLPRWFTSSHSRAVVFALRALQKGVA